MEHYLGVAKEKGITDNEIGTAQSIVMAFLLAGSTHNLEKSGINLKINRVMRHKY